MGVKRGGRSEAKRLLGAHVSIAGGLLKGIDRGRLLGCDVIQLFTKNSNQWVAPPLSKREIEEFQRALESSGIELAIAHSGYLINLATVVPSIQEQSLNSMRQELERAEALELPMLVVHPGSHKDAGEIVGIMQVVENLRRLFDDTEGFRAQIVLESTSGQGASLGYSFEHFAEILDRLDWNPRLGVCIDTAHVFQAGYDISKNDSFEAMWRGFDETVGLKNLKVIHLNDSLKGCGSRVDRHGHIGKGKIGVKAFKWLLNDKRFKKIPMLIETPTGSGLEDDRKNLEFLRGLIEGD